MEKQRFKEVQWTAQGHLATDGGLRPGFLD